MAKIFYTDKDIEDLAKQGVDSILINDDVVLTDLAREKARKLEIALVTDRAQQTDSSVGKVKAPKAPEKTNKIQLEADLNARVFQSVKSRLGDQVDDALLRTIVKRVIQSIRRK